ncbi:two-component system sensor kinase [Thermotomaculum hydrothermale]|uniref:histidine kinase n=1 Tax=Thermotomaculum hydrothermale TaxID=981385 RepID=A0A7R6PHZ8_9BACT|nr:HAMP domain-containing sensor histidine kinase [Thermotomaculum hydrothermale]BBB32949.1 two-component system sensor kinase [Thermotomaculum hydrothermale]
MKNSKKFVGVSQNQFFEILNNKTAQKIKIEGYKKILIPYNSKFSFCIFVSETTKEDFLPLFMEDILKNIPVPIIIFDNNFKTISTNITNFIESNFFEKLNKKAVEIGKQNISKLSLLESVTEKLKILNKEYRLFINPLIKGETNPGYICTIENLAIKNANNIKEISKIAENIISALSFEDLSSGIESFKKLLHLKTAGFYINKNNCLSLVFSPDEKSEKTIDLPAMIKKEFERKRLFTLHRELCLFLNPSPDSGKYFIFFKINYLKKFDFIFIASSDSPIEPRRIQQLNWLLKVCYQSILRLKRKNSVIDIFDNYQLPVILVNKKTMKIVYSNSNFKNYFGKSIIFLNEIFAPESNIKLLKGLEQAFEPFTDYFQTILKDNFKSIAKAIIIPDIVFEDNSFFAVIFKTQRDEINLKFTEINTSKTNRISLEAILKLTEKYTALITKTKNIEKSINYILSDIAKHLNLKFSLIGKLNRVGNSINILYEYFVEDTTNSKKIATILKKKKKVLFQKNEKVFELYEDEKTGRIFATKLKPIPNMEYIWVSGTKKSIKESIKENLAISNFANILQIMLRKKSKESSLTEIQREKEKFEKINNEIISTLSHEIKTPLTSIIGLSEILTPQSAEKEKDVVSAIKTNALNLLNLLENILQINKMKQNGIEVVKKQNINTNEFMENINNFVKGINKNPNVTFRIQMKNPKPCFYHDPIVIYRIIVNLLDNAFRYTKRGVVTLAITFYKEKLLIEVKDTGEGISKENLDKIFIPFFQESSSLKGNRKNSGLGLYIVKQLCDIIKGEIMVNSEKNVGSYFKITIPLKDCHEHNSNS